MKKQTGNKSFFSKVLHGFYDIIKNEKPLDTVSGFFVIFVALFFLFWAFSKADLKKVSGYNIVANFTQTGGVKNGADVMINGVKVGSIKSIDINQNDYSVIINLAIVNKVKLPSDSIAEIATDGLLGNKYVKITVGKENSVIAPNDPIKTVNYQSLEELIGQILFSKDTQ